MFGCTINRKGQASVASVEAWEGYPLNPIQSMVKLVSRPSPGNRIGSVSKNAEVSVQEIAVDHLMLSCAFV